MEAARTGTGPGSPDGGADPAAGPAADPAADPAAGRGAAPSAGAQRPPARPGGLVWAFGAGLLVVLVAAAVHSFWLAGLALAGLLAVLAVLHLVLPVAVLGPLAVRTPWVDAATCLVLAAGTAVLAVVAPGGLRG